VWARVNLDVAVAYDTDLERATALIDRVGAELAKDPDWRDRLIEAPTVSRVNSLGEAGLTLKVLGQVQAAEQWAVAGELRKRILAAFAADGIEIPYPRRVMVTRAAPGAGEAAEAAEATEAATEPEGD
jgi:small conductance mechanosensitive channel